MRPHLIAVASWLAFSASANAAGLTFVYKGGGCTGVANLAQYTTLTGRAVDGASDFLDSSSTWPNMVNVANWGLWCWKGKVANLSLGIPMAVAKNDGSPLHELAAGDFNTYYKQIAQSLVSNGFPNAYLRIGWEFNGNWYPWAAANSPSLWIQGFQQIVKTMRSVPGQHFSFVWNPALYNNQVSPTLAYPGDAYVDVIATDAYNISYDYGYKVPTTRWNSVSNDSWGLSQVISFAKQHNKPYAIPEWGTGPTSDGHGGGDDPMYLVNMLPLIKNSLYSSYFDWPSSQLSGNVQLPAAMAAFIGQYGSTTAGSGSGVAVERNLGAIMERSAAPFTPTPLSVTATGGYATAIQNGPGHYNVIVWTAGDVAGKVTVNFGTRVSAADVYHPEISSTTAQALGSINSTTITLTAGDPVILTVQM